MSPTVRRWAQSWAIPVIVLVLWEIVTRAGLLDPRFFPPLSDILATTVDQLLYGRLGLDVVLTVQRLVIAFAFAAVFGVAIGVASGRWRTVEMLIRPITDTLYPLPKIALLPLFIIIVGRGEVAYIITAFATAFFQIIISTRGTVREVPTDMIEAGRNFGATGVRFFTRLLFPAIAPGLMNGLRLGMATCLITLIAAEFVGAEYGLGAMIRRAGQQFAVAEVYAGILIVGLLGLLINLVFRLVTPLVVPAERRGRRPAAAQRGQGVPGGV
ncbi:MULTISPECIES: ABC transporter permease [unclassified Microbacterium]|uniref:ABC transporter permease n=1 Tax=unclassified Microbacterium TaxID=2609290 RepID=UPI00214CEAB7|nr:MULTISPECIES: ABC transporter permease [unclassified Microbacterium]MCR2808374.1 ABC transporter permease [Microbacterium sp. zg.B185]WIM19180.1 ABC transporter permease [Microbacterium sp. zg-B185]